jgi:hypothetical protein
VTLHVTTSGEQRKTKAAGALMIGAELFVIPEFGVAGLAGTVMLVAGPGGRRTSARSVPASWELNESPHGQQDADDEQQDAHSRRRSPITRGPAGLPVAPAGFCFDVGDDRGLICHRRAAS